MRKKRLIPFWLLPASIGKCGKLYKEAELYYYYDSGYDLEEQLILLHHDHPTNTYDKESKLLTLKLKYNKITNEDYERDMNNLDLEHEKIDEDQYNLKLLEIDYKYKKITKDEYEKNKANLDNSPWVGVIESGFDKSSGVSGFKFKLDWNDAFIDFLMENGYSGASDDEIVEMWFNDVNRANLSELAEQDVDAFLKLMDSYKKPTIKRKSDDTNISSYS